MPDPVVPPPAAPVTPAAPVIDYGAIAAAVVAALPKPAAPVTPPPAPDKPVTPQSDKERLEFLEKRDRENTEHAIATARNGAIDAALAPAKKDFSEAQLSALRAVLERDHGKNIVVEGDKTFYNSPQTGKIEIGKYIADTFLKSDVALALKPAPTLPGGAPTQPGQAAAPGTPDHKWATKTFTEVRKLCADDPDAYDDMRKNHPKAFAAMLQRR